MEPLNKHIELAHVNSNALGHEEFCAMDFIDLSQVFDKVWHPDLLLKKLFDIMLDLVEVTST